MSDIITISVIKTVRQSIIVKDIGFKNSVDRFLFVGEDAKLKNHPFLFNFLKHKNQQFVFRKTVSLPLDRNDVISSYYNSTSSQFHFNGNFLKNKNEVVQETPSPSPSQLKAKLNRLKFNHQKDDVNLFLKDFKELTNHLDETASKCEMMRFFKKSDQANLISRLSKLSIDDLFMEFYSLYKEDQQNALLYYSNLRLEDSNSLERFLEEKLFYFKNYQNLSLSAAKNLILPLLPSSLSDKLDLYQSNLSNYIATINYICLRAEELNLSFKIRKRDEMDEINESISSLNNISIDSHSEFIKLDYPKRGSRY